jgi:glycosyltransferase involved in cell wall biosynthesis
VVYDCLFPWTVGGAERWYRNLAERLAAEGHEVTYLTRRQWDRGERVEVPGVRVVGLPPRTGLYTASGRRRIDQALLFGAGVLLHLARHGRRYDVVHTASFPYFSLLAAAALRRLGGYRLVVDWHEVWTRAYWREYLGPIGGRVGTWVQRRCVRARQQAFCFSRLHAARLRDAGLRGEVQVLEGEWAGPLEPRPAPEPPEPLVLFAGRHIPEKRAPALVPALALARERAPELRAVAFGDGPDRPALLAAIEAAGLDGAFSAPGFVDASEVDAAMGRALCLALPSRREGYGLVVVEACSRGTPAVVVRDPDNAATELVEDGVNGVIAPSASPEDLAQAILRIRDAGDAMRRSTIDWFAANAERLSLGRSLDLVAASYAAPEASARS